MVSDDITIKTKRNHALTVPQMVMVTLRFLATGSFLQVVGDTIGLHKGTASRIVSDVLTSLCNTRDEFIKWPRNVNETRGDFYRLSNVPNVLGAIDGTHVRIQAQSEDEASFVYDARDGMLLKRGGNMKLNNEGTVNKFIRQYDCDQMYALQQKDDTALEYEDSSF
ncbi:putative nuclease HARBI1 [Mytilus edulis]|uniref:putative nuclease HARBI1 n=1 Tax=Mytilus edulis TaxID=6550 RepID=UPI0039EE921E